MCRLPLLPPTDKQLQAESLRSHDRPSQRHRFSVVQLFHSIVDDELVEKGDGDTVCVNRLLMFTLQVSLHLNNNHFPCELLLINSEQTSNHSFITNYSITSLCCATPSDALHH